MPIVTLSAEFVRNASCPEGRNKENYFDISIKGFILEVRATGGKTYALRYKDQHGRQRQHKIGDSQSISFDKAKNAATILRSKVVLGENPSEEKKVKQSVPTISEFCRDRYLPYSKGFKRSSMSDESYLRCHILPNFGSVFMDKITTASVMEFHHGIRARGYALATANHALAVLRAIYTLAIKLQVPGIVSNPGRGVKFFEANNARERYLTAEETQRLYESIEKSRSPQLKYIIPLLLLLGCRKRELLDSRWEDFDLERRTWRIPMSKSGRSRHVPLSKAALGILAKVPRFEGCPYVVPNPETLKPYISIFIAWKNARRDAGLQDVRLHDLRHSMASNMINSGRGIYEVARILGHTQLKHTQRYTHLSQDTLLAAVDAAADATGVDWNNG